jgi:hypothetical protein
LAIDRKAGNVMATVLKFVALLVGCSIMMYFGVTGLRSGTIYCKGRWYSREEDPFNFWLTVVIYLAFPPIMGIMLLVLPW